MTEVYVKSGDWGNSMRNACYYVNMEKWDSGHFVSNLGTASYTKPFFELIKDVDDTKTHMNRKEYMVDITSIRQATITLDQKRQQICKSNM